MTENPTQPAAGSELATKRWTRALLPSGGWREMAALFALLTPQEARLLALVLGLLILGLSVRFVHLRLETSTVLSVETNAVQPAGSRLP
jgi:hypothetical protein